MAPLLKYARVLVFGLNKELVLTKLCGQVVFYDIEKTESTLAFSLNKKDFNKVMLFLKRRKIKFKDLKKINAVFAIKQLAAHAGILLGVAFWVVFYIVFSSHHFGIKIEYSNLTTEQNAQALSAINQAIKENSKTNLELERETLTSLNFISGVTIKKVGLNYLVWLYGRTTQEPNLSIIAPYNLKIKEVVVASGQSLVNPGDVVAAGAVLAKAKENNGIIEPPKVLLKAEAYVIGSSFFDKDAPVLRQTGNSYSQTIITLFGLTKLHK